MRLVFLHYALQRMLVFAGEVRHLHHLGFGHFVGIDAAFANTMLMHMHHDSLRRLMVLVEEPLQHVDDEFHRCVVVIQQQHAVEAWALGLRLSLGNDRRTKKLCAQFGEVGTP